MSGLSPGMYSCSGEGSRFLRGGVGERSFCLKNVRILPCFFFCGLAFEPFVDAMSVGISSSVEGAEEREESESAIFVVGFVGGGCGWSCGTREQRRSTARHV
jgi:hypothetical protein